MILFLPASDTMDFAFHSLLADACDNDELDVDDRWAAQTDSAPKPKPKAIAKPIPKQMSITSFFAGGKALVNTKCSVSLCLLPLPSRIGCSS